MASDVDIIIQALESQRNTALTQAIQLQLDKFKLQEEFNKLQEEHAKMVLELKHLKNPPGQKDVVE